LYKKYNFYPGDNLKNIKDSKQYSYDSIDTSLAGDGLSDTLNRVSYGKERIIIRRHGKEIAVLVPMEDLAFLEELVILGSERELGCLQKMPQFPLRPLWLQLFI
jgi:prevent-host-death family protein